MARPPPALDIPFHSNLEFVVERRRGVLRKADAAQAETRRVPIPRKFAGGNQRIHRGTQQVRGKAVHLARRSRRNHRGTKPRVPNVGINPLGHTIKKGENYSEHSKK